MKTEMNPLDFHLTVDVDGADSLVHITLSGFDSSKDAIVYAKFLESYLPLMLFESTVMH